MNIHLINLREERRKVELVMLYKLFRVINNIYTSKNNFFWHQEKKLKTFLSNLSRFVAVLYLCSRRASLRNVSCLFFVLSWTELYVFSHKSQRLLKDRNIKRRTVRVDVSDDVVFSTLWQVWWELFPAAAWQCPCARRQVHKEMFSSARCGGTWQARTQSSDLWPLMFLCLNGRKSLLENLWSRGSRLMLVVLEWHVQQSHVKVMLSLWKPSEEAQTSDFVWWGAFSTNTHLGFWNWHQNRKCSF